MAFLLTPPIHSSIDQFLMSIKSQCVHGIPKQTYDLTRAPYVGILLLVLRFRVLGLGLLYNLHDERVIGLCML
jgi:hypothetical protein